MIRESGICALWVEKTLIEENSTKNLQLDFFFIGVHIMAILIEILLCEQNFFS